MTKQNQSKTLEEHVFSTILNPLYLLKFGGAYVAGQTALHYFAEKGEVPLVAFNAAIMGALGFAVYSELRYYVVKAYNAKKADESQ